MITIKHLGDITKIKGDTVELVDVVTGGSPCQDLSCAGKRAGLAGERSGLFMEQIRIIKEMRNESRKRLHDAGADYNRTDVKPRYMVWENVAGAFSSNKGEDFRAVLEETAKVADKDAYVPGLEGGKWSPCGCILGNGWSIAWRLHDAQYWGVPQRRKRICLLADFNGDTAGRILFELQRKTAAGDTEQAIVDIGTESRSEVQSVREGVSRDTEACRKEGQGITEDTERCAGETSKCLNSWDVQSKHIQPENGVAEPLYAGECRGGGGEQYVMQEQPVLLATNQNEAEISQTGICNTLPAAMGMGGEYVPMIAFEPGAASRVGGHAYEDVAGTVRANAGDNQQAVVYGIGSYDSNAMKSDNPHSGIYEADTSRTLDLNGGNPGCNQGGMAVVQGFDAYNQASTGDVAMPLRNKAADSDHIPVIIENHPADSRVKIAEDGICQTLSGRMETGGGNVPMVMEQSSWDGSQVSPTLTANNANGSQRMPDKDNFNAVISAEVYHCTSEDEKDVNGTLAADARKSLNSGNVMRCESVVRRLTPMECERLQNFPDNWTDIGDWIDSKGKTHKGESDSPRYKALGNSIALPFWAWMAERMMLYLPENPTMASLFDGISGFCLVFARAGCKPIFSSEIEEFPIAVAKKHFGDDERGIKGDYEKYL